MTEAFDINRPRLDRYGQPKATAMLPTLGARAPSGITGSLAQQFTPSDVESYLLAMHASIGDTARQVESSFVEAAKALGVAPPSAFTYGRMSFMPDPANYGLLQWPGINPESLRKISRENVAPQMIIRSRIADIARYSGLSTHPWKPGWQIVLRDAEKTPSKQDLQDIRDAERFVWNCNRDTPYSDARERDQNQISNFEMFLRLSVDDMLTFDGWSTWTDMDRSGRIKAFATLPASLIRLTLPGKGYRGDPKLFAALVDETNTPIAIFNRDQMTWRIRNARTDPGAAGYGWCYAEDTEVLTQAGWKLFKDADIDTDVFATMEKEFKSFQWQKATHKVQMLYVGIMYHLTSRSVDILVTPNHRVLVRRSNQSQDFEVLTAEELYELKKGDRCKEIKIPMVSSWEGVEIKEKHFKSEGQSLPITLSGNDYCAFMGAYLAEGYVPKNKNGKNVYICQRMESKGYEPYRELLTRILGMEPYFVRAEFVVCRKSLADHVALFGDDCYSKRIPDEILNATPDQLAIFFHYFMLGDGRIQDKNSKCKTDRRGRLGGRHISLTTTSKIMADQLQELVQKLGYAATINTRAAERRRFVHTSLPRKDGTVVEHDYESDCAETYNVLVRGSDACAFSVEQIRYAGEIGCVTVPNGFLYVRRNGRPAWCGNSEIEMAVRLIQGFQSGIDLNCDTFVKNGIPNGMLLLKGDYWNQEQVDALMREWTNMKRGISKVWGMPVLSVPDDGEVEIMSFMDLKGQELRYKDHLNLMMGACCTIYQYPIRKMGMFASGGHRDNAPVANESLEVQGADDPGLPPLLIHVQNMITEYLIAPSWAHLCFMFRNVTPKEDAREYEARKLARTWGESRAEADLPKLKTVFSKELEPLAEIMEACPEDPNKSSVYQTIALEMLKMKLGTADDGDGDKDAASPEPEMRSKVDPAKSEAHGHRSGVRRDSAAEEKQTVN